MLFVIILILSFAAALPATLSQSVTVETGIGNIIGQIELITYNRTSHSLITFYGIPYAEPPTGTRRFQKPVKKQPFTETFRADTKSPICYQNASDSVRVGKNLSENCLFLNIYVPGQQINGSVSYAVMIWIYGGGFQTGYQDLYDARAFSALNDVIFVTMNYRVSVLGFLTTGENNLSGNYGLWDQHLAIKWVHDHIDKFGGDPNTVTIFGESAGSASVIYQALYEGNQGLFHRVIAESGTVTNGWAYMKNPRENFIQFATNNDCLHGTDIGTVDCLSGILVDALDLRSTFGPVKDGEFIKLNPLDVFLNKTVEATNVLRRFGQYDLLIGFNSAEGGRFVILIDPVATEHDESISGGYSRFVFETIAIDIILSAAQVANSPFLKTVIVNEYVDWYDPTNELLMLQKTVDMGSDVMFNAGIIKTADSHSKSEGNGSLFVYMFDHKPNVSVNQYDHRYSGADHEDEIIFALGFPQGFVSRLVNGSVEDPVTFITQEELILSRQMMIYWTNFAKYG